MKSFLNLELKSNDLKIGNSEVLKFHVSHLSYFQKNVFLK